LKAEQDLMPCRKTGLTPFRRNPRRSPHAALRREWLGIDRAVMLFCDAAAIDEVGHLPAKS